VLADLNNNLWLYDIETCKLSAIDDNTLVASNDHSHSVTTTTTSRWRQELPLHDCIIGFTFNPSHPSSLLAYGITFLLYLDLTPSLSSIRAHVIHRYQPLLFTSFLVRDTLLVLEQPWEKILPHLPPPFERRHFAT
jgi:hypothetical protein